LQVGERRLGSGAVLREHFRTGAGRPLVDAALADYWTGTVPEGDGLAVVDAYLLAWALTHAERWDEACTVWERLGGRRSFGYPWLHY
jgi:hypothetical protein